MTTTTAMDNGDMDYSNLYTYTNGLAGQLPMGCSTSRASYQNPAHIKAWAASAAGSLCNVQQALDIPNGSPFPSDGSWNSVPSQTCGCLPHSYSSDGSDACNALSTQQCHGSMINSHSCAVNSTHNIQLGDDTRLTMTQGLGYGLSRNTDGDFYTVDLHYAMEEPYPLPSEDDLSFPLPANDQPCMPGDNSNTLDPYHGWPASMNAQEIHVGIQENSYSNRWAAPSEDRSISSRSSHHPDTPLSSPQDQWDEAVFGMHSSTVTGSQSMIPTLVPSSEAQSTMRPSQGPQRSRLPGSWMPSSQDLGGQAYGSPISTFPISRRSSEGEPLCARQDPLYQIKPRDDGHWQCIFVDKGKKCDHAPFPLKCNYDKHLDSHLKPYRCKQPGCAENPFSSTACLLRHEREAHGMHNHKEVLCRIQDCDRSFPGKGFPRKWNANDHMKRVHQYTPPEDSNSDGASSPSSSSVEIPFPARSNARPGKRRIPSPVEFSGVRKTKAILKRATKGGVKSPSSRESSQCQDIIEQYAPSMRTHPEVLETHPEVLDTGLSWTQWQHCHAMQMSGQDFFPTEAPP